jgi:hypothetical protein
VIALHSAGVPKKNAAGELIDKNGQVIRPVNGQVEGDQIVWLSNRGIRVSAIMEHMRTVGGNVSVASARTDSVQSGLHGRPAIRISLQPSSVFLSDW